MGLEDKSNNQKVDNVDVEKKAKPNLYLVTCDSCGRKEEVSFDPKGHKAVYCNKCYHLIKTGWLYIPENKS
jgi:CxxC-x17-CxxC domain-containing protein